MGDEKKHKSEARRYAVLSKETVRMFAEAGGHADLPDEVLAVLAEDVSYRVREATQNSCHFMRHARRKRLVPEDFNKALRVSDVQPVFGHGLTEPNPFRQTKEGDLYFVDDLDITLPSIASSNHPPSQLGETTVKAQWLAVEGVLKGTPLAAGMQAKVSSKVPKPLSDDLLTYYDDVTKAILGTDEEIMKLALVDLRTNSKISPLLQYFVNFVSNGVKTVSHDISQLLRLLHTVSSLISNPSLYLEPKPYLTMLVQTVMYCLIEPLAASINPLNDHWVLRDYAAHLLAHITRDWDSPINNLREQNLMALQEVLYDQGRPFCSHYGAVMGLVAFGTQAVEDVLLPRLASYCPYLTRVMNDNAYANAQLKADAHKVHGALLLAAECYLLVRSTKLLSSQDVGGKEEDKSPHGEGTNAASLSLNKTGENEVEEPTTSTPVKPGIHFSDGDLIGTVLELPESTNPHKQLLENYSRLVDYFGDSLCMKLPHHHVHDYYCQQRPEVVVTLGDENTSKTGEELLQQFLVVEDRQGVESLDEAKDIMDEAVEVDDDGKSDSHSLDPATYGIDFEGGYDGDEKSVKSERSERSSRSSRSERSHSDETYNSFTDADDLTVKAVSESTGIKLFITKRSKVKPVKSPSPPPEDFEDPKADKMPTLVVTQPKRITKRYSISEVFETVPFHQPPPVVFVFRFQRREQMFRSDLRRVKQVKPVYRPVPSPVVWKTQGRIPRPSQAKKLLQMHHYSSTLEALL